MTDRWQNTPGLRQHHFFSEQRDRARYKVSNDCQQPAPKELDTACGNEMRAGEKRGLNLGMLRLIVPSAASNSDSLTYLTYMYSPQLRQDFPKIT